MLSVFSSNLTNVMCDEQTVQPHLLKSPGSPKKDDSMIHELTDAQLDFNVSGYFYIFLSGPV